MQENNVCVFKQNTNIFVMKGETTKFSRLFASVLSEISHPGPLSPQLAYTTSQVFTGRLETLAGLDVISKKWEWLKEHTHSVKAQTWSILLFLNWNVDRHRIWYWFGCFLKRNKKRKYCYKKKQKPLTLTEGAIGGRMPHLYIIWEHSAESCITYTQTK